MELVVSHTKDAEAEGKMVVEETTVEVRSVILLASEVPTIMVKADAVLFLMRIYFPEMAEAEAGNANCVVADAAKTVSYEVKIVPLVVKVNVLVPDEGIDQAPVPLRK